MSSGDQIAFCSLVYLRNSAWVALPSSSSLSRSIFIDWGLSQDHFSSGLPAPLQAEGSLHWAHSCPDPANIYHNILWTSSLGLLPTLEACPGLCVMGLIPVWGKLPDWHQTGCPLSLISFFFRECKMNNQIIIQMFTGENTGVKLNLSPLCHLLTHMWYRQPHLQCL